MEEKVMHIASGQSVADDLISKGVCNVYAFNEAMCEGHPTKDIYSYTFCVERANAYGISLDEYYDRHVDLTVDGIEEMHLYFDYDMFCCMNVITLLAYLEQICYKGNIIFHLVEQNGTANVLDTFVIQLGKYYDLYENVLILQKFDECDIDYINQGIKLYLNYKQEDNEIISYIKKHHDLDKTKLCKDLLQKFMNYGLGDITFLKLIDTYK